MAGTKRSMSHDESDDEDRPTRAVRRFRKAFQSLSTRPRRSLPRQDYSHPTFRDYVTGGTLSAPAGSPSPSSEFVRANDLGGEAETMDSQQSSSPTTTSRANAPNTTQADDQEQEQTQGTRTNGTARRFVKTTKSERILDVLETIDMHRSILPIILLKGGRTVNVCVISSDSKSEEQFFTIYQDLLSLHSSWFRRQVVSNADIIHLRGVSPALFAKFAAWLYQGMIHHTLFSSELGGSFMENDWEGVWFLGMKLGAPNLQNYAMMELLRTAKKETSLKWPKIEHVNYVVDNTERHSMLYEAVVDGVACQNPLEGTNSSEVEAWEGLLEGNTGLHMDITRAMARCAKWGKKAHPGDEKQKGNYYVYAVPVDQVWSEQILQNRSKEDIQTAADGGCIRSLLELAHLSKCNHED